MALFMDSHAPEITGAESHAGSLGFRRRRLCR